MIAFATAVQSEPSALRGLALIYIKRFCFPHTIANKLTGFLLFIAVPTIGWHIIPIAIVAITATFAAIQEGHSIIHKIDTV